VPFSPQVVLWIHFLVQVPIAIALGFDKPSAGLMDRKPRPLTQPVLTRGQWARIVVIGLLMTVMTLAVEWFYGPDVNPTAATMGFVVFSLLNVAIGLAVRSETETAFTRDIIADRHQLLLYGLALLLTWLPTELDFIQTRFGLTSLDGYHWLVAGGLAFALLLASEVVKFFVRRRRSPGDRGEQTVAVAGPAPA
jgi:Ca2+-transporting ATPase